ncbi:MAG: translation initiation factor IF-2 [Candidatus Yanofskybacteria bacterium]|nr:translation initiation factor IF-2 [Candidatus Yanofskybacteria bacterium]
MAESSNKKVKNVRPPVVVVLGHVDHGKTKLLSAIRNVAVPKESGGITQHIGAYQVEVPQEPKSRDNRGIPHGIRDDFAGRKITFLDTPGHEAFSAIRSRGARVADIAILVVAADESVKPQTKEAIKIIKQEKMPFIVALNKIDKEGANVQKVKQDLATEEVLVEDWGGNVPVVEISAKQGKGISELMDMIILVADLEDLGEDLSSPAKGLIIESNLDKRVGYVATALVHKGVLRLGDWIVAGTATGKIKAMEDFTSASITEARPSQPVRIIGWSSAPNIGIEFSSAGSKDEAVKIAEDNVNLAPLLSFFSGAQETPENKAMLNIIFKSDVTSSLEAIDSVLRTIKSEEVGYRVIGHDIGNITEADVKTAIAGKGQVVGFRVTADDSAKKLAEREGVKMATFDIIYELIEYVREQMADLLGPVITKIALGKLKVLATFKKDPKFQVIGGRVISGKAIRGAFADVLRGGIVICNGRIGQLQHNKEDLPEVKEGLEAGIKLEVIPGQPFQEIQVGDMLEIYEEQKTARTL